MTKETALDRLNRMQREKEESGDKREIVETLTHQDGGEANFSELAEKLGARKEKEKKSALDGTVKYTIYVDQKVAEAFDALCLKRGDQRRYGNEALAEFVMKKARELGI